MMLDEWNSKPKNKNYILLKISGDVDNPVLGKPNPYWTAKDITNIVCSVYNTKTHSVSDKSAYINKRTGRLYLKSKDGRLFIDEFK